MSLRAYYNENDRNAAAWLRELIADGLIAKGDVDERSIAEVEPKDIQGYGQCHFFAGIGCWSYALRLAGIPDAAPVWTGSCPCQPLSGAGKRRGHKDERHLWPEFYRLIRQCAPSVVFGEQVESKDGREWLAGVFDDLEAVGYAVAGADLCAAGVQSPHIRQRLYWMGYAQSSHRQISAKQWGDIPESGGLAYCDHAGPQGRDGAELRECGGQCATRPSSAYGGLADTETAVRRRTAGAANGRRGAAETRGPGVDASRGVGHPASGEAHAAEPGQFLPVAGLSTGWRDTRWHYCRDGKYRRVPLEPSVFPLADGTAFSLGGRRNARTALLRGAGNAIVPQLAAVFIEEAMQAIAEIEP